MIKSFLISLALIPIIYLAIAVVLIFSQFPDEFLEAGSLDFTAAQNADNSFDQPLRSLSLKDDTQLNYREFAADNKSAPLMILLHGSGWHGGGYQTLAGKLAAANAATVIVPDLRGHGPSPERRGDLDYIGQFEDDIAELIVHKKQPGQKIVIAGHSSGGGLAIRFAGGKHGKTADAAVLIAPFLKYNAPTMRPNSGGWAYTLVRRTIGLVMLNNVGITSFNHLTSIQFAFPKAVLEGPQGNTATDAYSYRLNTSFAPRDDYLNDISGLPSFLLVVGEKDEAFIADAYEPTMEPTNQKGRYAIIAGSSHLGIIHADETANVIGKFLAGAN